MKQNNYFEVLKFIDKKLYKIRNSLNIQILSNFNTFYLKDFIQFNLLKKNLRANFLNSDFDQIEQQLINVNFNNIEYLVIANDNSFLNKKVNIDQYFLRIKKQINFLINLKKKNDKLYIIFFNLIENLNNENYSKLKNFNKLIQKLLEKNFIYYFNINKIFTSFKNKKFYNKKNNEISKILYSEGATINISEQLSNLIISFQLPQKKCLVLDLDDTLWGGTIGETDYKKIKIGKEGEGKIFFTFQNYIKKLSKGGVILAIASKNNLKDVKNFFSKNKNRMPLKLNDFSIVKANWIEKYKNITAISKELNIGKDSIVFFDNSKFEQEQMRQFCPEVSVIEASEPSAFVKNLEDSYYFSNNQILKEDGNKRKYYHILEKAKKYKATFNSNIDFLKSLKMKIRISKVNKNNFSRCVQMINKTNQFNLTTVRFNEIQFNKYIKSNNLNTFVISLKDKFGDHGVTGMVVANHQKNGLAIIDFFLLSCRILGRNVENFLINEVALYLKNKRVKKIQGIYYRTKKNFPFRNFYIENGFSKINKNKFILNTKLVERNNVNLFDIKYE